MVETSANKASDSDISIQSQLPLPAFLQPASTKHEHKRKDIQKESAVGKSDSKTPEDDRFDFNTLQTLWQQYQEKNKEMELQNSNRDEKSEEERQRRKIEGRIGHLSLHELQSELEKYGLNEAGTKVELKDKLIQFLLEKKQKEKEKKSGTKRPLSAVTTSQQSSSSHKKQKQTIEEVQPIELQEEQEDNDEAYKQHRILQVTQFFQSLGHLMEPSDQFPERNLASLTIHIPLMTANPNTHESDPFFQQCMLKHKYPFIEVYQYGSLDDVLEPGRLTSGDIILLPPGDHYIASNRCIESCKTLEIIGMKSSKCEEKAVTDVVIQIEPRGPSKKCSLKLKNCFARFHQIRFSSLPSEQFEVSDLVRLDQYSIGEFSYCKFENEDAALAVQNSSVILNHCYFDRLGKYAIRIANLRNVPQSSECLVSLNDCHFTRCCLGTGEIHSKAINPTKKGSYGVIYLDHPNLKDFQFKIHNCSFVDNEADSIVFETKQLPQSTVNQVNTAANTQAQPFTEDSSKTGDVAIDKSFADRLSSNLRITRSYVAKEEARQYQWANNKPSTTAVNRVKIHLENDQNSMDQQYELVEINNQ